MQELEIDISYSQIAVFDSGIQNPFNDWDKEHVDQGFSWREGSVSFAPLRNGKHRVRIQIISTESEVKDKVVRAFRVPLSLKDSNHIEIGSPTETKKISLNQGNYGLQIEFFETDSDQMPKILVSLYETSSQSFETLKADRGIRIPKEYLLVARPAV